MKSENVKLNKIQAEKESNSYDEGYCMCPNCQGSGQVKAEDPKEEDMKEEDPNAEDKKAFDPKTFNLSAFFKAAQPVTKNEFAEKLVKAFSDVQL